MAHTTWIQGTNTIASNRTTMRQWC